MNVSAELWEAQGIDLSPDQEALTPRLRAWLSVRRGARAADLIGDGAESRSVRLGHCGSAITPRDAEWLLHRNNKIERAAR